MKKFLFIFILTIACAVLTNGQTEPQKVCIDADTASKCSKAFDEVVALRSENETLKTNAETLKTEIQRLREELIKASTRATMLETQQVSDRAIIQAMIPMLRKKKIGIFNIF